MGRPDASRAVGRGCGSIARAAVSMGAQCGISMLFIIMRCPQTSKAVAKAAFITHPVNMLIYINIFYRYICAAHLGGIKAQPRPRRKARFCFSGLTVARGDLTP